MSDTSNENGLKKITKITKAQIAAKGVRALADRPNEVSRYGGQGGLSAAKLKEWFDQLATLLAERINDIGDALASEEAAAYICLALEEHGITTLQALIDAMLDGSFAGKVLQVHPSVEDEGTVALQYHINTTALNISRLFEVDGLLMQSIAELSREKLDKVTVNGGERVAYVAGPNGSQSTVGLSETPSAGKIPVYDADGHLWTALPVREYHAVPKRYVDEGDLALGSALEAEINPETFELEIRLVNIDAEPLSVVRVDLPLEEMIVRCSYADGAISLALKSGEVLEVDVSDIVSGLVNEATHKAAVASLNGRIDEAEQEHDALEREVGQSKIYAHAAYHAEEAEAARGYVRGGEIDRKLREIDRKLAALGAT